MKNFEKNLIYVSVAVVVLIFAFLLVDSSFKNNEEKVVVDLEETLPIAPVQPEVLPLNFEAKYSSFQNYSINIYGSDAYYPNEFKVVDGEIDCDETSPELSLGLRIMKRVINGKNYCVGALSEGAAGSVYTQYAYATVIDNNVYVTTFLARDVDCNNYPESEKIECQAERESFNLDNLVDGEVEKSII